MKKILGIALGVALLAFSGNVSAEECHRGTLDKKYCDRDYNQTADLPLDESQWSNPDTIIFLIHTRRRSGCLRKSMGWLC